MGTNFYSRNRWLALCLLSCMMLLGGTGLAQGQLKAWRVQGETLVHSMKIQILPVEINGTELTIKGMTNPGTSGTILDLTGEIEGGYTITAIADGAFRNNVPFTTIKIAKTVKTIGVQAFCHYSNSTPITSVEFEEGSVLETIGNSAFHKSEHLTTISLPASIKKIDTYAFRYCTSLESVYCAAVDEPDVENDSFKDGSANLKVYATEVSSGWTPSDWGLNDNQIIYKSDWIYSSTDNTITNSDNTRFKLYVRATGKNLTIAQTDLTSGGYNGELDLTGTISDGYTITAIADNAFFQSSASGYYIGSKIILPKTLKTIGKEAFRQSIATSVEFEEDSQLETIGEYAFAGMSRLEEITIPASVKTIMAGAFANVTDGSALATVTFAPDSRLETIGKEAFFKTQLTEIALPEGLKKIGEKAFLQTKFTEIVFPASLDTIEASAFSNTKLIELIIPASIDTLGEGAFSECGDLLKVTFADNSATKMGNAVFRSCTELTSANLPSNIKVLPMQTFESCSNLSKVDLPKDLTTIQGYAFDDCAALTSISLPASISSIANYAFKNCSALDTIYCAATEHPTIGNSSFKKNMANRYLYATAVTGGWDSHTSEWGLTTSDHIIYKVGYNWTYSTNGKLTHRGGSTVLTATLTGNTLAITGCEKMDTTFLELDSLIVKEGDLDTRYSIASIGANALAMFTAKDTLRLTADEPFAIDATAFNAGVKDSSIIYVPKGKVDTYANADVWKDFLNFIEEGAKAYPMDLVFMKDTATSHLTTQLRAPIYRQEGKEYSFFIASTDSANYGVPKTIKAYKNGSTTEAEAGKDYNYDPETGKVSITTVDANWKFEASAIGVLKPDEGEDLIITSDSLYTSGIDEKQFNGTIDGTDKPVPSIQIGDNEKAVEMTLVIRNLAVSDPGTETNPATTVTPKAKTLLILEGNNNLGVLKNEGSLTISQNGDANLNPATIITNEGTLIDSTGLVTKVKGTANLELSALGNTNITEGSTSEKTVTFRADEAGPGQSSNITFQWYKLVNDEWQQEASEWLNDQTQPTVTKATSFSSRNGTTIVTNTKALTFSEATTSEGKFRCEVTRTVTEGEKSVITTLNTYTEVKFESASPDITYYQVTLPAIEGATTDPKAGSYDVEEGYSFSFTITLDKEYDLSTPVVKVGDKEIEADTNGKYVIKGINANITISVTGIVKNTTVGNAEVENAEARVWYSNGTLHVYTPQSAHVRIVSFSGSPYKDLGKVNGDASVAIRHGSYIVIIGERTFKIVL